MVECLHTVFLRFDSGVVLSCCESISTIAVCVRHVNDCIPANVALLVLILLVNNAITNFPPPPQGPHSTLQPIITPQAACLNPRTQAKWLNATNVRIAHIAYKPFNLVYEITFSLTAITARKLSNIWHVTR